MIRTRRSVPLLAALAAAMSVVAPSAWAGSYWDDLAWQGRPLVLVEGGPDADDWTERLRRDRCALAERRIHWLVIDEDGAVWRRFDGTDQADVEQTRLGEAAAREVRDRVGWSAGEESSLVLFGLDGQEKYRGRPDSLDTIWSLIDRMPMRRAEMARKPDDCGG